ncbi:hypothetical protein ACEOWG_001880 [Bacillus cereus]
MILESILIGGAIGTISKMVQADKLNEQAEKINVRAFERAAEAEEKVRKQNEKTQASISKLINRKRGIYQTSIATFLELYQDLQKINFEEGEGLKELSASSLTPVAVEKMKEMTGVSRSDLTDSQVFATYIFTGISGLIKKDAKMNLSAAKIRRQYSGVIEKQSENICIALDAISQRSERMAELLKNLNALFIKSLKYSREIVERNGGDKTKYTLKDREAIMVCFNFAKGIKDILDVPLLDKDGEITKKSLEAIETGEAYLSKINKTIHF